jgi:wyosine [tRNA(Phe)-imidazoG37] synthetase (radical SAM superfamily)
MAGRDYRHLFGPVRSRRMGWSLGIDLVPYKTCCYNCPFCQLGKTHELTLERRVFVPVQEVINELADWANRGEKADYLTLAGSGEPTLHLEFGSVLQAARRLQRARTALLSNGALFHRAEVRQAALAADVIKASLSAWNEASFRRINRPHPDLHFNQVYNGIRDMRQEYNGEMWLEVFLFQGVNDAVVDVRKIAALAASIRPDRIQLNTIVRPPAENDTAPVPMDQLWELAELFTPLATVLVNGPDALRGANQKPKQTVSATALPARLIDSEILFSVIRRHPCTLTDIAAGVGIDVAAVQQALQALLTSGRIVCEHRDGKDFYMARK